MTTRRLRLACAAASFVLCLLPGVAAANYEVLWEANGFFLPGDGLPASYIGDVDGDGSDELVGRNGTRIQILDLRFGTVEWTSGAYSGGGSITLMDIDEDGTPEVLCMESDRTIAVDFLGSTGVGDTGSPQLTVSHSLGRARPNPFNPSTTIDFDLGARGDVDLRVYDVSGRLVDQLMGDRLDAGRHTIQWDGRRGGLSSGAYFIQLRVDGAIVGRQKVMMVK